MSAPTKFTRVRDMTGLLHMFAGEVEAATDDPDDVALGRDVRALVTAYQVARARLMGQVS